MKSKIPCEASKNRVQGKQEDFLDQHPKECSGTSGPMWSVKEKFSGLSSLANSAYFIFLSEVPRAIGCIHNSRKMIFLKKFL